MARLVAVALAAVISAVLATGCGSSSPKPSEQKVSATAYVTKLCRAVAPFEKELSNGAGAVERLGSKSPSADRSGLVTYFGALASDSATTANGLAAAGVPDVPGGTAFATAARTAFARMSVALKRSQSQAEHLTTASPAAFQRAASGLTPALSRSLSHLSSGISTRKSQALNQAAAKVSACHTF